MANTKPVVVALDYADLTALYALVDQLDPEACRLKVGKEAFTRFGPDMVRELVACGFDVFLDLKFHDIPNTVAKAVASAAELGVWMVNVHASGGSRMMKAAAEALKPFGDSRPLLIGVTVLTSMDQSDLDELGLPAADVQVARLASLAAASGLDGVVCSAQEVAIVQQACGEQFITVTPGIRPAGSVADDQRRTLTPKDAILQGSDYLVIGRPITQSGDPLAALQTINTSIFDH
ncbi:Orotidine 5'-phosphate decarboxylase [BD1-7 clade bacterium]|uniref:Orotidine 5'-phosphate decarboxylase n=1 Tax=BD1-7 clade bacterium TaxID=2029982 RepID=A0A5S9PTT0_9GAMM|nr:Orotidine 5'-phosphate decarboxylase [BD1-7 clade bacterium]CAA0108209.1 Orotidine 5'-phosphate decarboxylase [BD1-7 clade bacterium]